MDFTLRKVGLVSTRDSMMTAKPKPELLAAIPQVLWPTIVIPGHDQPGKPEQGWALGAVA